MVRKIKRRVSAETVSGSVRPDNGLWTMSSNPGPRFVATSGGVIAPLLFYKIFINVSKAETESTFYGTTAGKRVT